MIWKMYSVFDAASKTYLQPFCSKLDAEAIRSFSTAFKDAGTPMFTSPLDFTLFRVGDFDDSNGIIAVEHVPVNIASGASFAKPAQLSS